VGIAISLTGSQVWASHSGEAGGVPRWYTERVPTRHHRIQVTEDPELTSALRTAAPHLPSGLPRSQQIRELAIVGAQSLAGAPRSEPERHALLNSLAETFDEPAAAGVDWDVLRESKQLAWPAR
jgi:hypothetical protein